MSVAAASIPVPDMAETRPLINPWIIAVTVTLATFMELLATAIANVRSRSLIGPADLLSDSAGGRRRRPRSRRAGHSCGYVPSAEATRGFRALQHGHCDCACNRPAPWRLDYRQLELAVDLLYQYPHRDRVFASDEARCF